MKRMKKLYSITEQTIAIIQKLAEEECISESWALDNAMINYWRMTHKKQDAPKIALVQKHVPKKEKIKELENEINETIKFADDNKQRLTEKQLKQVNKHIEELREKLKELKNKA